MATPGAIDAMADADHDPLDFLRRHSAGDWGFVDADDWQANDDALENGGRLLSAYHTRKNAKLWVITDAEDGDGKRQATTILLPEEY